MTTHRARPHAPALACPAARASRRVALAGLALTAMAATAATASACLASSRPAASALGARPACTGGAVWTGSECASGTDGRALIERGARALAEFRVEDALALLREAERAGPHAHADNVRIHEQLGIAHAYLDHQAEALAEFAVLLSLSPGHLLSYTLSPKATFLFERAREQASARGAPQVDVNWPRELDVTRPIPIDVEVVADPAGLLRRASLNLRVQGEQRWRAMDLGLPGVGGYQRITLPALALTAPAVLELYLTAHDEAGNEVLVWSSPARPREIALDYDPPAPWYRTWWVVAGIASAVAVATGGAVYALTREPPDTVGGQVGVPNRFNQ